MAHPNLRNKQLWMGVSFSSRSLASVKSGVRYPSLSESEFRSSNTSSETLKTSDTSETAEEIAQRNNYCQLAAILKPNTSHLINVSTVMAWETQVHALIKSFKQQYQVINMVKAIYLKTKKEYRFPKKHFACHSFRSSLK